MAASVLAPLQQILTSAGALASGYQLFVYVAGTSTKQNSYPTAADAEAGTNANTNPVILNSRGEPTSGGLWLPSSVTSCKLVLTLSTDSDPPIAAIRTQDNIALGADTLAFLQAGNDAVVRSVQARMRDTVCALDFLPVAEHAAILNGTSTYNSTTGIQAAIATGKSVDFVGGYYLADNLTQSQDRQWLYSSTGMARIVKRANGVLFTSSGADVTCENIDFRGDASTPVYTGHNVVSSGANFSLINCGSRWAYARAVLATGNHVQIVGTCDIYQTAEAAGYDIEIGVSGTATLYHQLVNVYSSQATGGIKLIDTGSAYIDGGQFGKLYIAAGTGPAGVNGGLTVGARILGDVTVDVSSAVFAGNQFGAVAITFGASTSKCSMDASNSYQSGHSITNNGNDNNYIARNVSTGSTIDLKFGDDASACTVSYTPTATPLISFPDSIYTPNNKQMYVLSSSGGVGARMNCNGSDVATFGNSVSAGSLQVNQTGDGPVQIVTNSIVRARIDSTGAQFVPNSAAIATTATTGFVYLPSCAGPPTGTPTAVTGGIPAVVDSTNHKLYFYSGGSWRDAGP